MKSLIITCLLLVVPISAHSLNFIYEGAEQHKVCLDKVTTALGLDDTDVTVYLREKYMQEAKKGYVASTKFEDTFILVLNLQLAKGGMEAFEAIAHEMVHIEQHVRGIDMPLTGKYRHRANEIEAFDREKGLSKACYTR